MLSGVVNTGEREWNVREEKRAGPQDQLFILTAADGSGARMHVRSLPGAAVTKLEEVELLAADPEIRWFADEAGAKWETRLVLHSEPNRMDSWLVKFISQRTVVERPYPFKNGLGRRTDDELRGLLRED